MNKDTLIVLVEKDIAELQTLTRGFAEMTTIPQPLIDLAVTKVESLRRCLDALPDAARDMMPEMTDTPAPVELPADTDGTNEMPPVAETEMPVAEPIVPAEDDASSDSRDDNANDAVAEESAAHIVAETIRKPETVVDVFEKHKDTASVAATIAKQPVTDIKRAISIADRFRFQRELFGNNGEQMAKALDALNDCTSLEQAEAYLDEHCTLPPDNPATADFVDLIKRRFA